MSTRAEGYSQLCTACLFIILQSSHEATVTFDLEFRRAIGAPDGFKRSIITANNIFPGPVIRATAGDTLVVSPLLCTTQKSNPRRPARIVHTLNLAIACAQVRARNLLPPPELLSVHWHGIEQVAGTADRVASQSIPLHTPPPPRREGV